MKKRSDKKNSAGERSLAMAPSTSGSIKTFAEVPRIGYPEAEYAINKKDEALNYSDLCKQGTWYACQNKHKKAVNYFARAIGLEPNNHEAYVLRAESYHELREFYYAVVDLTTAIANTQEELHILLNRRGVIWFKLAGYNEAMIDFTRAIELMPNFFQAINNRAYTHLEMGYYQAAIDGYRRAKAMNPEAHERDEQAALAVHNKEEMLSAHKESREMYLENRGSLSGFNAGYPDFIESVKKALIPLRFLTYIQALGSGQAELDVFFAQASIDELRNEYSEYRKLKTLFDELEINPAGFDGFVGQFKDKLAEAFKGTKNDASLSAPVSTCHSSSSASSAGFSLGAQENCPLGMPDTSLCSGFEPGFDVSKYLKWGEEFLQQRNHDEAIGVFTQIISLKPKFPAAYYYRGVAHFETNDYDLAIQDLKKALKLKSKFRDADFYLAEAYANKGEFEDAIRYYTKAIKQKPNLAKAFHKRCLAYKHINEFRKAYDDAVVARKLYEETGQAIPASLEFEINCLHKQLDDLLPASATQSQSASSASPVGKSTLVADAQPVSGRVGLEVDKQKFFRNGLSAFKHHDYLLAIENYRVVEHVYPEASLNMGHCYKQLGLEQSAIKHYKQAIRQRNDNYPEAYYNMGCIYQDQDDYDRAVENYKIAINQKPEFSQAYYNLCLAYMEMNEFYQALRYANEAREAYAKKGLTEPEGFSTLIYDLHAKMRDTQQTREVFIGQTASSSSKNVLYYASTNSISSQSSSAGIAGPQLQTQSHKLNRFGNQYARCGNYSEAIHYYKEVIKSQHERYPLAFYNLGVVYLKVGNYQWAIENFSEAIRQDPKLIQAYTNRGAAYYNSGNYTDAIEDFNKVTKANPEDPRAYYSKCLALKQRGEYGSALSEAQIAIRLCKKPGEGTILHELETIAFGLQLGQFQLETGAYGFDAGVAARQRPMGTNFLIGSADASCATPTASISGAQAVAKFVIAGRCNKANTCGYGLQAML